MRAVVTAGGRIDGAFAELAGTDVKALAPLRDGATHLDRVLDALAGCGIREIAVVGGTAVRDALRGRARWIAERETGAQNVRLALEAWPDDAPLVYATSDMPFVETTSLRDFLDATPAATLAMPLAEGAAFHERFPDAPPAGITLGGEEVVNGGVFLMPTGSIATVARVAGTFFDARKAPWKMASLVGPAFLVRFAFKRLTIAALEAQASRTLGVAACAVRNSAPELAFDCDRLEEYRYARDRA